MGKKGKKGRSSSGTQEAQTEDKVIAPKPTKESENLHSLDDTTLTSLRQKIEEKLALAHTSTKSPKQKTATASDGASKQRGPQKSNVREQNVNKGKKRDRNGDIISGKSPEVPARPPKSEKNSRNDILRDEILALGGNEGDYELLAQVDSGDDGGDLVDFGDKSVSHRDEDLLREELSKMLQGAGYVEPVAYEEDYLEGEADKMDFDASKGGDEVAESELDISQEDGSSDGDELGVKPFQNPIPVSTAKEFRNLTIPPRADWYNTPLPQLDLARPSQGLPRHILDNMRDYAKSLLEEENRKYTDAQRASSSSSHKFYTTIMSSGTLSDKISALTLAVQESPLHNVKALDTLVGLAGKRSRAQAVDVLRSLKDLFAQGTLLPTDRKLKHFGSQPLLLAAFGKSGKKWTAREPLPSGLEPTHLICWAFEDHLKDQFFEILKVLETWCNDEIEFSRTRAVSYVFELLKEKPEQEANLLRLLVNKLGDPSKKIASRASYLLLQLEQAHPLMKPTIVGAVEEFLFRPSQSSHARYYATITLNQTVLSAKEEGIAAQLLNVYFSLFVILLKPTNIDKDPQTENPKKGKKGSTKLSMAAKEKAAEHDQQLREKLVSALLTGVNRAYPFTNSDSNRLSQHIDTLFRITHSSNFNTSIQALMLIQQLTTTHKVASDRFYRTLYESLLDPRVALSSKQSLYLNLLYKALKDDLNLKRVKAFVKRLLQILTLHQPSFVCGVFFLVQELEKTFPALRTMVDQAEADESDDEEIFRDVLDEDDAKGTAQAAVDEATQEQKPTLSYDPRKRDPQHSNADNSCLWELFPYLSHFHPSVSVSAEHLLSHKPLTGKPDLTIHTLSHFLDRFVYRTPKAPGALRGSSLMQPLAGTEGRDLLVGSGSAGGDVSRFREPVNSEAFWRRRAEDVAAEDVFFHEYFNRLGKEKKAQKEDQKKGKKNGNGQDDESEAELGSDNESEIWQALVDSRPELEGDEGSDVDLDMDDLESAYEDDSDQDEVEELGEGDVIFNEDSDDIEDESDRDAAFADELGEEIPRVENEIESTKSHTKKTQKEDDEDDDDEGAFDMDVSDDEAFRDSDEDLPSDLEIDFGSSSGLAFQANEGDANIKQTDRKKRRKLKHLPLFASADEYAALLANEDEGT